MKISKSTQKRVIALFVLVCLMLLPDLIISVLHVVIDEDWRTTDKVTLAVQVICLARASSSYALRPPSVKRQRIHRQLWPSRRNI